jgi:hypothetical protein
MIIFPITRNRFLEETKNTTLISISLPVISDEDDTSNIKKTYAWSPSTMSQAKKQPDHGNMPEFMRQRWSRYFEIPGVGVFWYIRSFNKILTPQPINLEELLKLETRVSIEHWAIELLDKEKRFPYNFYYRLSGTGTEFRHSLGANYDMEYDETTEESLLSCIQGFYDNKKLEENKIRYVQFNLRDTIHGDTIFCSIQEEHDWDNSAKFLVGSEINIPVNIMECLSDRYLALSIISLKYDG